MPELWYYQSNGKTFGPASAIELRYNISSENVRLTDLVRRQSSTEWVLAASVLEELKSVPVALTQAASAEPLGRGEFWRESTILVMRHGSALPHRCVKCNGAAITPIKSRNVYWHHPLLLVLLFLMPPIYAAAVMASRKQATINPGLCLKHRKRRTDVILASIAGSLAGLSLFIFGGANEMFGLMWIGIAMFLASMVTGVLLARVLVAEKIDVEFVRLKGCGEAFLSSLPGANGV